MEILITFLVTVAAGVVCHLISKWLDRHDKGFATIKEKKNPRTVLHHSSGISFFVHMELITFLCLLAL